MKVQTILVRVCTCYMLLTGTRSSIRPCRTVCMPTDWRTLRSDTWTGATLRVKTVVNSY